MKTGALFRYRHRRHLSKLVCQPANLVGLTDCVRDTTATVGSGKKKSVSDARTKVCVDGSHPVLDAHQTSDIARVTVGVPTRPVGDHESTAKVVLRIE